MSSSRPSSGRSAWATRWGGVSLRTRLVATILLLMAVVCLVVGVVTTVLMQDQLMTQLDRQVEGASIRTTPRDFDRPPPGGPGSPGGTPPPGLVVTFVDGVAAQASVYDITGTAQVIPADALTLLAAVPVDGHEHSVDVGALGDYRVLAKQRGDVVQVAGLPVADVHDAVRRLIMIEIGVALAGLGLAGLAGAAIVRLNLRPLRRVAATASRVAELPLAKGEVDLSVRVPPADTDPRTEVGQVGAALNRLLGHVGEALAVRQASEVRVRQFVADASHELRTPLAAIRGYSELARRSRETVPADVAHALSRVESASARMTTLVDDLLLLARLDSGRPLDVAPVDLSRLAIDALSDAHAAGPRHVWVLDLPEYLVTVPGDTARLHQVLANLLANARIHTHPGTTIRVGLTVEQGWAVLTVTDDGPGIPPDLQAEVFERFTRGDNSRSRAAGSTGLGLAIVAAVVDAHAGQVEVSSRPGRTSFAVHLPSAVTTAND